MIDSFRGEYRFLSNFYPAVVAYEAETYPSVEHAYQAAKTTNLNVRAILAYSNLQAADAKAIGSALHLRPNWEQMKLQVMWELLTSKFSHKDLAIRLFHTGDHELVEGNTWNDTFWGVCKGVGENHLGKLLMKVRAALITGEVKMEGVNT